MLHTGGRLTSWLKDLNSGPRYGKEEYLNQGPPDFKSSDPKHSATSRPSINIERFELTALPEEANECYVTFLY